MPRCGLSVFASWIFVHTTLLRPSHQVWGFPCRNVNFRAHDAPTSIVSTTDKCGAFRVRNVYFRAHDAPTSLASTTDQCGAHSGSPQLATKFLQCHYKYVHDTYECQVSLNCLATVFILSRALCAAALLGGLVEATSSTTCVSSTSLLLSSLILRLFTT